jgi:signal transduction histidine kinase/DNA-binding response OmpR family regulator/ligand-binding sensor domain-containing protein
MWFGLDRGIVRYDGYNWTFFDDGPHFNAPITSLKLSADGKLYAGGESGLFVFDEGQWQKLFPRSDTLSTPLSSLAITPDNWLLAGIPNGILMVKDNEVSLFTVLHRATAFKEAYPYASIFILPDEILFQRNFGGVDGFYVDDQDYIWAFMSRNNDGKLLKFILRDTSNQVVKEYEITDELGGFKLSNRTQLLKSSNDDLWIINGFYKSGILRSSNSEWELLKLSSKFGGDELHTDIMELNDGSIWIGALGKLYVYRDGRWSVFSGPSLPIPSSRIIFHEGKNGYVWIAGIQGDVFRISYNDDRWQKYNGLNFQFSDDKNNEWYLSADNKVVYREQDKWLAFDQSHGLIDAPSRLVSTRKGRIWVAGSHQGTAATAYLDKGTWIKQLHPQLSWGIDARSVFQDKQGVLWFGASVDRQEGLGQLSGVLQLENPDGSNFSWRHFTQRDGINQQNVYGIGQSPDGDIWLGGTNLLRYDGNRWQSIPDNEYLNNFVDIVHSRQNLWVGSRYYGVFRFDGNNWSQYSTNNGLPSNTIIGIYEERPDRVWVITDKNIAFFDGERWFSGLFSEDFAIPREGGDIVVDNGGSIWLNKSTREWKRRAFPFSVTPPEAMEEFWTVRYKRGANAPKTQITIFSEKVDRAGNTFISWTGQDFWKETPTNLLTYSYRLNNEPWTEFSYQTSVVLTKLNSGRHRFEVRARNLDLNVEQEPVRVEFTVAPPIWKQRWFIALVLTFLIIIGFYEVQVVKRNKRLSRLNASLSKANVALENRQKEIEIQKEIILEQKESLEKKAIILEQKTAKITSQRDQLKEMVDKVEELSNVKQRFFTNISHEFRTPLTLILGSIEKLLKSPQKLEENRLNAAYEIIHRNSKRILKLINQILEIRKIELGKIQLETKPGDIVVFTREIVELFDDLAKNQALELRFETNLESKIVLFDQDLLEKVLFNLLSNAFKNTPAGGRVIVSLFYQNTAELPNNPNGTNKDFLGEYLVFEVSDSGRGIPEKHLAHIFERFYQVPEGTPQRKIDSSGIGLSYAKDLVEIHGGNISVESIFGQGARFRFSILCPLKEGMALIESTDGSSRPHSRVSEEIRIEVENIKRAFEAIEHVVPAMPKAKKVHSSKNEKNLILIVEDEPELRDFLKEIFEDDFEVIEARNGRLGYEMSVDYQPDLIITDVMMPEMDGLELCSLLNDNLATNHIPVIMLTARTAPENKYEGYAKGADAYIEKPFKTEYLKLRVTNLLSARENIREKISRDLIIQPTPIEVRTEEDKMLRKIQEILEENVSNSDFDVESMSQNFYLSRCHFSRKIKQITGLTPKEIIDSYRLKRAGQLLQQNFRVTEVAYMVGFDHPNSFTRAFRKFYNMTPTEFASQN